MPLPLVSVPATVTTGLAPGLPVTVSVATGIVVSRRTWTDAGSGDRVVAVLDPDVDAS